MLGQPTDRTSVHPAIDVSYAAGLMNKTVRDCFIDPAMHARALENVFSVHPNIDGLYINLCLSPRSFSEVSEKDGVMQILDYGGMRWTIPENDVGTVGDHDIRNISDERMKLYNPLKDGINDTFRALSDDIKQKYLIIPGLTGPFSQVVFMLGLIRNTYADL